MNGYINLVNKRSKDSSGRAIVLNTFFFTMLEDMARNKDYNFNKLNRIVNKKCAALGQSNLTSFERLLLPINRNRSHWLLLDVNLARNKIELVDSLTGSMTEAMKYYKLVR